MQFYQLTAYVQRQASVPSMVERMMMERANETIIIADSNKLEKEGFLYVCDTEEIDKLVTDQSADPSIIKKLKQKNIKVILG